MPLNLFYTMVQKSQKWPKTQIKGGPALRSFGKSSVLSIWERKLGNCPKEKPSH